MRTTDQSILPPSPRPVKPTADSQCGRILRHLEDFGSITAYDAMREYGCMRLAPRISELKDMGYGIISKSEVSKNRYGQPVNYTRYFLEKVKGK